MKPAKLLRVQCIAHFFLKDGETNNSRESDLWGEKTSSLISRVTDKKR